MILFTCHKREMEYLDEMGIAYHKIDGKDSNMAKQKKRKNAGVSGYL